MVETQDVRPQDVIVLTQSRERARQLANRIADARIKRVERVHCPFEEEEKDSLINPPGCVTVSTVHSAKGYDAACVLLASANEFHGDVEERATF
jgi:superfamily I DNA and RNA helicase